MRRLPFASGRRKALADLRPTVEGSAARVAQTLRFDNLALRNAAARGTLG